MKIVPWIVIGGRLLAVCAGLTLLNVGCGGGGGATSVNLTAEEEKRNVDTRKAMEEASRAAKAAAKTAPNAAPKATGRR